MVNKTFFKDFSWYFLGSFLPLLIGFIKTPIFTRYFDKEAFGHLGLVTITFSYFGMLLFSWIASCIWRYYHKYYQENELKKLYSNLIFLLVLSCIVVCLIAAIWYSQTAQALTKKLIFYALIQLIFNQLFLCYMVLVRLQARAGFYTIFQGVKSVVSISLALLLVFVYKQDIAALVLSLAIVDVLALVILSVANPSNVSFAGKFIHKEVLKELLSYGGAGLIINIGFLVIASSDRYIIAWLTTIENVGVYDQVYKISQMSVWAFITIYFNTINPYLLNQLEQNFKASANLMRKYLKPFFLYGLPIVVYLSLFSKDIATIFLGSEFREGYTIMPFIFFAAYFHGISNFYELRLKFSNKLKRLTSVILLATLLNIIMTYVLVLVYGYRSAAITTTFIYVFILSIFHYYDRLITLFSKKEKLYLFKMILVIGLQVVAYLLMNDSYNLTYTHKIVIGFLFIATYFVIFRKQFLTLDIPVHD